MCIKHERHDNKNGFCIDYTSNVKVDEVFAAVQEGCFQAPVLFLSPSLKGFGNGPKGHSNVKIAQKGELGFQE